MPMDKKQKQALLWFLWGAALLLALLAAFVPQPEGCRSIYSRI